MLVPSPADSLIAALGRIGKLEWHGCSETPPHKVIWRWSQPQDSVGEGVRTTVSSGVAASRWNVVRYDRAVGGTNWCLIATAVTECQEREGLRTDAEAAAWLAEREPELVRTLADEFPDVVSSILAALPARP